MSAISLEAALRTCKVDTGWANKIESDRFLNPNNMMCPIWNGVDTAGRAACPDSFWTKRAGCNSATDRIVVENNVSRPQYMEYINLSANGIAGNIYGDTMAWNKSGAATKDIRNIDNITGRFGLVTDYRANVYPSCDIYPYQQAMAQEQQANRNGQAMQMGYESYARRYASGN